MMSLVFVSNEFEIRITHSARQYTDPKMIKMTAFQSEMVVAFNIKIRTKQILSHAKCEIQAMTASLHERIRVEEEKKYPSKCRVLLGVHVCNTTKSLMSLMRKFKQSKLVIAFKKLCTCNACFSSE